MPMLEAQLEDELEQSHLDVTLTNTTLLSIFFGLVVVCGVFFGFGYSLGGHKAIAAAPAKEFTAPRPMPETASLSASSAPTAPKAMEAAASKPAAGVVTSASGGRPAESATSLPAVIAPAKPSPVAAAVSANHADAIVATKTKTVSSSVAPAASVVAPAATARQDLYGAGCRAGSSGRRRHPVQCSAPQRL